MHQPAFDLSYLFNVLHVLFQSCTEWKVQSVFAPWYVLKIEMFLALSETLLSQIYDKPHNNNDKKNG